MTSEHIKTRRKLKEVATVNDFKKLLEECILSDEDKKLLEMHYLSNKDFRYIGDALGFAEQTIKYKHKNALQKLSNIL